jgi:hypothetical protein
MWLQVLDLLFRGMGDEATLEIHFERGRFKKMDAWEAIHSAKGIPCPDEPRAQRLERQKRAEGTGGEALKRSQKVRWQHGAAIVADVCMLASNTSAVAALHPCDACHICSAGQRT